jgi:hypothetical protein
MAGKNDRYRFLYSLAGSIGRSAVYVYCMWTYSGLNQQFTFPRLEVELSCASTQLMGNLCSHQYRIHWDKGKSQRITTPPCPRYTESHLEEPHVKAPIKHVHMINRDVLNDVEPIEANDRRTASDPLRHFSSHQLVR